MRRDLNNIWMHFNMYHRYTTWQKFLIDRWENLCDYLNGKRIAPVIEVLFKIFQKNSNINHTCPYREIEIILAQTIDRMILDDYLIALPLLPSGDYRFELSIAEGKGENSIMLWKMYFTISDIRVWH